MASIISIVVSQVLRSICNVLSLLIAMNENQSQVCRYAVNKANEKEHPTVEMISRRSNAGPVDCCAIARDRRRARAHK
jgi:hypothetical protein